jgi:CTP synthase (UTP-ammonia lyase)
MRASAGPPIAIATDYDSTRPTHRFTARAFADLGVAVDWLPSADLARDPAPLAGYGGVLLAPGPPGAGLDGALTAARYARETGLPLLGTCGGFQHVLIEFARNAAGIAGAAHAELDPAAASPVCVPLACSLSGTRAPVHLRPGTLAAAVYRGAETTVEPFFCAYGLNRDFEPALTAAGLRFSGFDANGEPRVLELPGHPFFLATLYVPQAASEKDAPHPVLSAFTAAAAICGRTSGRRHRWARRRRSACSSPSWR